MDQFPIHELHPRMSHLSSLWKVQRPPLRLFARGTESSLDLLSLLPAHGLAIVGTRHPQARSIRHTQKVVRDLAGTDLIIVSGLARGIDAAAHEAALEAGLATIAILGSGLNAIYPEENLRLAERIMECGGLLVSEFPPEAGARRPFFIQRNRLIASWANATWVAEAGYRSGALNTARWARDHHRTCFATPSFPGDPIMAGNEALIDDHQAVPVWGSHSFGQVWLHLAARVPGIPNQPSLFPVRTDACPPEPASEALAQDGEACLLSERVAQVSADRGGTYVHELLDWCLAHGLTPQAFFLALQRALASGAIREQHGVLVSAEMHRK